MELRRLFGSSWPAAVTLTLLLAVSAGCGEGGADDPHDAVEVKAAAEQTQGDRDESGTGAEDPLALPAEGDETSDESELELFPCPFDASAVSEFFESTLVASDGVDRKSGCDFANPELSISEHTLDVTFARQPRSMDAQREAVLFAGNAIEDAHEFGDGAFWAFGSTAGLDHVGLHFDLSGDPRPYGIAVIFDPDSEFDRDSVKAIIAEIANQLRSSGA